ncbi:GFA family protein [Sphingomonas sp.]|uniref:GFA family protein n=1 Tax=Sphingomonas sp. TaxID=28214 RepID=UPI002ED7AC15
MRVASCQCGAVTAACAGEPVRISVCHCLACQRRSGSAFAAQARFVAADVVTSGETAVWQRRGEEGSVASFRFCTACGSTVWYSADSEPELIAVALGAFADPHAFGTPNYSVYEERKFGWVTVDAPGMDHIA